MTELEEYIRLRVSLSHSIKFYLSIRKNARQEELKKLIIKLAEINYGLNIQSMDIKSEDGYAILKHFRIGEVLESNQVVVADITNFSTNPFVRSPAKTEVKQKAKNTIKEPIAKKAKSVKEISYQATEISNSEDILSHDSKDKLPINTQENVSLQPPPVAELAKKEDNVATPKPINDNTSVPIVAKVGLRSSFKTETPEDTTTPAHKILFENKMLNNFKGFAVNKEELLKNKNVKFDINNAFKPLKKRKNEEQAYDII